MTRTGDQRSLPRLSALAASVLVAFGAMPAYALDPAALPTGGQVAAGSATINQSAARMDVNQATQKAIINWSTFNIGSGASVNFAQPNSSSVVLNRVLSSSGGSEILGRMTANGQVFLVNPSGVLFGKTAQVDVGGLVATSLNISDSNFLAGRYTFASTGTAGSVTNEGTLRAADGGYIALLAPDVRNDGVIAARLGTVALAAGNKVTLDFAGDRLVSLVIDEAVLNALVENRRVVQADGGTVILAARSAGDLASTVVNSAGLIQAASISERDGVIRLEGGERGVVAVSGTLDASGRGAGERGGTIKVLGDRVSLSSGATLDASGDAGGGTVLVGGNYQGSGPEQNASATSVARGAQIKADALNSGDGGKVILWSNEYTEFDGAVSARGGANGGNGGFVETSSHGVLSASGTVNTLAPLGAAGLWLLDPTDLTITTTADANVSASSPFQPTASGSVLTWATIDAGLAGGNVAVQTTTGFDAGQPGNITIANSFGYSRANSLTLTAANNIVVNGSVTNYGAGALTMTATGSGSVAVNQNLTTSGGAISITGGTGGVNMANGTTINAGAGTISIDAGGGDANFRTGLLQTSNATAAAVSVTNASTLELGNVALTGAGAGLTVNHSGAGSQNAGTFIVGTGTLTKQGTGTLTLSAANTYTGATAISAGVINVQNNSALGSAAAGTTVASGAALQVDGSGLVIAEPITSIIGTGIAAGGALRNLANNNIWTGAITLGAGGATVNSDGGTLTLSGGVVGGGNALTFGGAGNITETGVIAGAGTTLTMNGTGMLTLSGANTYTGLSTINSGIVDVRNNTGLGTVAGATTVASGAAVQIDGGGLLIAEPITSLSGTGIGGAGALRNLANNNTWSGAITLGAGASITSDADTLTLSAALGGGGNALTFGGAGNITESAIISGVGTTLTKNGTGTLTLSGANTYTGATTINAGTLQVGAGGATGQLGTGNVTNDAALVFNRTAVLTIANAISGAGTLTQNGTGTITLTGTNTYSGATYVNNGLTLSGTTGTATSTAFTLNQGGILTLDNSGVIGNNNNDRIAGTLTMNGGQIAVIGNANINTTESLGTLNLASGYSTVTLTPNAARNVRLSFTDVSRSAGALALFRGTNLGVNTVASQTANSSNIEFTTTPPGLVGAGNSGTTSVGIIPGAIGAITAAGNGTDFVTYNPPTGALNGVRILAAGEYLNGTNVIGPAVGVNYRLTANRTADDTVAVNSLLLNGFTYNYDSTALSAANTLTVTSGNILSVGAANTITTTVAGNASPVDFGATEGKIFTVTNLSLNGSTTSALTGTAGVTKGGAAATLWTQTSPTLFTSGITVAGGTLTLGANNVIADTNPVTVNAGATFNPAGFSDTIGALTLFSGTTGASVTTGAGTLTLGGNLALNVNGAGSAAATITGNLGLGATRTFTVNDGSAASDLSIAAIVSGVGFGLNKAGAGTLTLTGANTFSGGATIQAGALSGTVAAAFGTGTITIGDSVGSNNATLNGAGAVTFANAISVQSGNTGVATITDTANSTFSGLVTLNHDLTLQTAANTLTFTGATSGFAGTGNLTLNATAASAITLSGTLAGGVNHAGTITNSGAGSATSTISSAVGANVTGITENSATSALTVSGLLTSNAIATTLTNTGGALLNTGGALFTVSGGVANTAGNLILNNNSAIANGITLSTTAVGNTGTITNSGTGAGASLISVAVNAAGTSVVENSATSQLTLSAANTYAGGTTIRSGTVSGTNAASFGTGTITIGHSSGAADATLSGGVAGPITNAISVASGNTGTATITGTVNTTFSGGVTLNSHDLTLSPVATNLIMSGNVTSTGTGGSLILNTTGAGTITVSGASINNTGTITNSGTGTAGSTISGVLGANVTGAIENSRTSSLTLSGNNAAFAGGTTIKAGTLIGSTSVNAFGTAAITIGDSSGVANATLSSASALAYTNAISVAAGNTGVATITDSANSTFSGAATLNSHDLTLLGAGNSLTLSGAISSTGAGGNLTLNSAGAGVITLSNAVGGINNAGTITNMGAGAAANVISGVIGANVTGVVENSATSSLTLSGTNTYASTTTINAGTLQVGAGGATGTLGTGAGNVVDNGTLIFNRNNAMTVSNVISGTGVVNQAGTGTTTLSGANTYTGKTSIQNGTLSVSSINSVVGGVASSNLGAPTTVANGTIDLGSGANTGTLLYTGTGETTDRVLNLAGTTGGGAVTQSGTGLLKFTSAMTATGAGNKTFTLQGSTAGTGEIAGAIVDSTGTTSLAKAGTGTWTLSGANTYSGATNINAGTIMLGAAASPLGTVAAGTTVANGAVLDLNGFTLATAEALTINGTGIAAGGALTNSSATNVSYSGLLTLGIASSIVASAGDINITNAGTITGATFGLTLGGTGNGSVSSIIGTTTGTLTKAGTGTWTLSGANTYTGATTINAGTLQLGVTNAIGASSAVTLNGTSTLDMNGFSDTISSLAGVAGTTVTSGVAGAVTLTTGAAGNTTFAGVIQDGAGTVALTKQGAGIFTLSGANTYTGTTNVNAGTLRLQGGAAIADTDAVVLANTAGVTLDLRGSSETIGSLAGGGATGGVVTNSTAATTSTLTTGDASNTTFAGVIQNGAGTVALTKQGAGTFTLSGANTYTGTTNVNVGTLAAASNTALGGTGTGTTVASGAELDISGSGLTIAEPITLAGTGVGSGGALRNLANSNSWTGAITLGVGGARINSDAGTLTISAGGITGATQPLTVGGSGDTTISAVIGTTTGTLTKDGAGTLTLSGANTFAGLTTVSAGTLVASNASALGTTAGGTTVSSGATLNINNVPIGNEAISIDGNGAGGVGALTATGTASLVGTLTLAGASRIGTTSGASTLTFIGAVNAAGFGLDIAGAGNLTATNAANDFGTVTINSTGNVSLVDANALTIGTSSVGKLTAQTLSGDLSLGGSITATGTGDTIVLAAAANFDNSGAFSLDPNTAGGGRWLVYSTSPAGSTEGGLTSAAGSAMPRLYNRTYAGNPPASISEPGNHLIYSSQPTLTVTPDNKTKNYGTNDPAQTYVASGFVNDDGVTDTAVTAGLTGSFGRVGGETVAGGPYSINQGTFVSNAGYSISLTAGQTLTINPVALTVDLTTDASKSYGTNDPSVNATTPTFTGRVNTSVTDWNATVTAIDDTVAGRVTLASLTRTAGETVTAPGPSYTILSGTAGGTAIGNYTPTVNVNGHVLTINPVALTVDLTTDASKSYGTNDPSVNATTPTFTGRVNTSVTDWNATVTAIDDTVAGRVTLASLTRTAGETVTAPGPSYTILSGTAGGTAIGNYTPTVNVNGHVLTINPVALTVDLTTDASKSYGTNDPSVNATTPTFTGRVNTSVTDWNATVTAIDDTVAGRVTLASLTRTAGETVTAPGPSYTILSGTAGGTAIGNYTPTVNVNGHVLTINPVALTVDLTTDASKSYGTNDPSVNATTPTFTGRVNTSVTDWNATVTAIDDTVAGRVTLASLTRTAGETVTAPGPSYTILSGTAGGTAIGNYTPTVNVNGHVLTINPVALTVDLTTDASKSYGTNDPSVNATTPTFTGRVNTSVTDWNATVTAIDDTVAGRVTLASLTRTAGETVTAPGPSYTILSGTAGGTAIGNYTPTVNVNGHVLTINPVALTVDLTTDASKSYGTNDPSVNATTPTFTGRVNTSVTDWNATVTAIDDTVAGRVTLASLTRTAGETVTAPGPSYTILSGTAGGTAIGNYTPTVNVNGHVLTINPVALTVDLTTDASKSYGTNDPSVNATTPTFTGRVNTSVTDWNATVTAIDDTVAGRVTLASLTRTAGETVTAPGPSYTILSGTAGGTAIGNYTPTVNVNGHVLTINPVALTVDLTTDASKSYGTNDPSVNATTPTFTGRVNTSVTDWNATVTAIDDTVAGRVTLASLTRTAGETVTAPGPSYTILSGTAGGTAIGNYTPTVNVNGHVLTINPVALTVDLTTDASKSYGTNDPSVNATTPTFTGRVNTSVTDWNATVTAIDDTVAGRVTLASLTRTAGETVTAPGPSYTILSGTAGGTAIGNYTPTVNVNGHVLTINPVALTVDLTTDASKSYGTNDPSVNATTPTFTGRVNTSVTDWNATVTAIDDTVAGRVTLASLTRTAGETVTAPGPSYTILSGTAGGTAIGNYTPTVNVNGHVLTINPVALTVDLTTDASKSYGTNDPSVNATTPTFTGRVNTSVTDWNATVTAIDDTVAGRVTLASLTRTAGETVTAPGPSYTILSGTAGGTAIGNYTPTVNVNGHVLTINPVALTVDLTTDASKSYGTNDPSVNATTPTFTGRVNTSVTDWNATVTAIDDTVAGRVTLASLTRTAGETVTAPGPSYTILSGTAGGTAIGNYTPTVNVNGHVLTINPVALTVDLTTDASKSYGTNDPSVNATTPTFTGRVNTSVTDWNATVTAIDDTVAGRVTLASLTRTAGETVTAPGPSYTILSGTAGGTAIGNYTPTVNVNGHVLTINPVALTVDLTTDASKSYGTNDPSVNATTPTFTGRVNTSVTDWNATVTAIDDTVAGRVTLASLTRTAGETVTAPGPSYTILSGTAGGTAIGNYTPTVNVNGHVLTINPVALTVDLTTDASKSYGTNDPSVNATTPTFTGRVNTSVTDWNATVTAIDDTVAGRVTLASLTRTAGETVTAPGPSYTILSGTAGGTAIGNYTPTVNVNGHVLTINPVALTVDLTTDASKSYGTNDPSVNATTPTFTGRVNTSVTDWNATVTAIDDTVAGRVTLASLTRTAGETVTAPGPSYTILSGTAGGTAIGNYTPTVNVNGHVLTINPVALTVDLTTDASKSYGTNDPSVNATTPTFTGRVNTSVTDWNATVTAIDDTVAGRVTLASLTRTAGETVTAPGPSYTILSGTAGGTAIGNYTPTVNVNGHVLTINPVALTVDLTTDASKSYGTNDPSVNATTPTFTGRVNTSVTDWNATVTAIDDTVAGRVTLASLTRTAGETVTAPGPSYTILSGTAGGTAIGNYTPTVNVNGHVLTINPVALTVDLTTDASKSYGTNDPSVNATTPTFTGRVNTSVTDWNATVTAIDDTVAGRVTLASLTRTAGETVTAPGPSYTILSGTAGGTAIGNYTPTVNVNGHVLTINPVALTVDLTTDASKSYGTNDPSVNATTPTFTGRVNTSVTDWNATVTAIDDTVAGRVTLASLTRTAGETVTAPGPSYTILSGTAGGTAIGNYTPTVNVNGHVLTINPVALTVDLTTDASKSYGTNDPSVNATTPTFTGRVNTSVTDWNATVTAIDDTVAGRVTLASLTRTAGETVTAPGPSYTILSGTAGGTAIGNYTPTVNVNGHVLTINPVALTVDLTTDASKSYGTNDPSVNATTPTFTGRVNTSVTDWNATVTAIDDTVAGRVTLASLTRTAGETVTAPGPSYTILSGTAGGTAIGNYTPTVNVNGHVLTINPVALTVDLTTDASKSYGTNDPSVNATTPTFTGRVNTSVTDWNATVTAIDDTVAGRVTLASLTRTAGETVTAPGPSYTILSGTAGGTAIGNYTPTVNVNGHVLTINPVALTVDLTTDASKSYGTNDPSVNATTPTFTGRVNTSVTDWNATVTAIDDTVAGRVTLASLTRTAGETVTAPGPSYTILSGTAGGTAIGNYTPTVNVNGHVLTINPVALTVTADDKSRLFGDPNPPFTATYSGIVQGSNNVATWNGTVTVNDSPASLGGSLAFSTPATPFSAPGTYPITPSGLTSGDYVIAFNNGILTVTAGSGTPVGISAFSALSGAIASTINPPGMGVTPPSSVEFTDTLAPTASGSTADGSATLEHISPTISIINCGIRSLLEGCGPR